MIGHDDDAGIPMFVHDFTDGAVNGSISLKQLSFVLSPEHMRILVDRGEIKEEQSVVKVAERITQEFAFVVPDQSALPQELVDIKNAPPESGRVFGDPLC